MRTPEHCDRQTWRHCCVTETGSSHRRIIEKWVQSIHSYNTSCDYDLQLCKVWPEVVARNEMCKILMCARITITKSVSAKRPHVRPMWAEGTLNRSMTGILIYSVRSVFSHSPLSHANVKPFRSKPTLVTSKLEHDIIHLPRGAESLPAHLTHTHTFKFKPWKYVQFYMQAGAGNAESIKVCSLRNDADN